LVSQCNALVTLRGLWVGRGRGEGGWGGGGRGGGFSCCLPRTVRPPNCSRTVRPPKSTPELFANCSTPPPNCSRTVRPTRRTIREQCDPARDHLARLSGQLANTWLTYQDSDIEIERKMKGGVIAVCCTVIVHCIFFYVLVMCWSIQSIGGERVKKSYRKSKTASGLQY
jgi:hypothetical protein